MRHLPDVNAVSDDKTNETGNIDLKNWQDKATSEDLHSLYIGEVTNKTHFQFHDLFFHLHYSEASARFFRNEILSKFRELINGTVTIEEIRVKAAKVDAQEQAAKAQVKAMIAERREARRQQSLKN